MTASTFLDQSRRNLIQTIAWVITASLAISFVALVLVHFVITNLGSLVFFMVGVTVLAMLGSGATLLLIRTHGLWLAVLPLISSMLVVLGLTGFFLRENGTVAASFCAVVVILASLGNNRKMTLSISVVSLCLAVALVMITPTPSAVAAGFSLGAFRLPLHITIVVSLLGTIWLIVDRFITSQTAAIAMADQQASEAEAARALAEANRLEVEQRSAEQQRLLDLVQTLELPIIPVGQGVLVVPLVGALDTRRMDGIRKSLLDKVSNERAHTVVLDVTGVTILDTAVARSLLQTAQAVKLLGAETMVSGIRATVAQTLVGLGVELRGLHPTNDLGQALELVKQRAEG